MFKNRVRNASDARNTSSKLHLIHFNGMINKSIYSVPLQFEINFISVAHRKKDIEHFIRTNYGSFNKIFS